MKEPEEILSWNEYIETPLKLRRDTKLYGLVRHSVLMKLNISCSTRKMRSNFRSSRS